MKQASLGAGLGETAVYDIVKRGRDAQMSTMIELALTHHLSLDAIIGKSRRPQATEGIPIVGPVSSDAWHATSHSEAQKRVQILPVVNASYPAREQQAYYVLDDSMDKRDIPYGSYVVTVPYWEHRNALQIDDTVIVVRERKDGLTETSIKHVANDPDGGVKLVTASNNESWAGVEIAVPIGARRIDGDPSVKIVGLVIMTCVMHARW